MPTILRSGPCRFIFYSGDGNEPAHIHVERDQSEAKYWLDPVRLERSGGFGAPELRTIERLLELHHDTIREAWNEFFGI